MRCAPQRRTQSLLPARMPIFQLLAVVVATWCKEVSEIKASKAQITSSRLRVIVFSISLSRHEIPCKPNCYEQPGHDHIDPQLRPSLP
jgi:hypothetical protein